MKKKLRVAILFGGKSAEHEISLISARNIVEAMDKTKYDVVAIGIDKQGRWHLDEGARLLHGVAQSAVDFKDAKNIAAVRPGDTATPVVRSSGSGLGAIDVVFPVLHGPFGEDGTIQGLFELAGVPFVGSGCAASAVGMDKAFMKGVFASVGLAQAQYRVILHYQRERARSMVEPLGLPLFVKPANLGSSVGVSKVKRWEELDEALDLAFEYDRKIVVEEGLDAREIELGILGNEEPEASVVGEIVPDREFYDYDSKYSAESRTELRIPAPIHAAAVREAQELGVRVFHAVDASGYARVDFLMDRRSGKLYVNEINTIPGFTSISMFPKLWDASGIDYDDLLSQIVDLAFERHRQRRALRTDYR